ncbi:hypothetical protein HUJ04_008743 [Dendroctonus ponderosae]|nr:hypothetical protein HUJ04_008743 [Dendroctonus ponderosae]
MPLLLVTVQLAVETRAVIDISQTKVPLHSVTAQREEPVQSRQKKQEKKVRHQSHLIDKQMNQKSPADLQRKTNESSKKSRKLQIPVNSVTAQLAVQTRVPLHSVTAQRKEPVQSRQKKEEKKVQHQSHQIDKQMNQKSPADLRRTRQIHKFEALYDRRLSFRKVAEI